MNYLTRRDVIAHQALVPWPNQRQVEQDLLLCRAMDALFNDEFLQSQIAMRGGTLLHKVYLAPASRYSEDIDLVAFGDRPEDHIKKAIRRVLADTLGRPTNSAWESVKLAVRNAVRPSRVLRLTYHVPSQVDPAGKPLEIVVEANVTERTPHREIATMEFTHSFRGADATATVNGFDIHELLGTKMRALFQRKRGRDLFDLFWALTNSSASINPSGVIDSFVFYMAQEGTVAGRDEFVGILRNHLTDSGFRNDMAPLLRTGIEYDPMAAGEYIITNLLHLLPEEEEDSTSKPKRRGIRRT